MKSFSVGLIFSFSLLALVLAAPSPIENKEDKAYQECNVTNPVQRNPRLVIAAGISSGGRIKLSQEEKCYLTCFLQKVNFLDENANIKSGGGLVNFTLRQVPELAQYSDVLIAQIFQISRSTKGFDDKCLKGFVTYHLFSQNLFSLGIAQGLQSYTGAKDQILNHVENGTNVDQELPQKIKEYLKFFDAVLNAIAQGITQEIQGQAQASNAQSQGSSILQQQAGTVA